MHSSDSEVSQPLDLSDDFFLETRSGSTVAPEVEGLAKDHSSHVSAILQSGMKT
jgi:hypothetical protein